MFLPTTKQEIKSLGWKGLDIILITGDVYIDSPFIGVAIIGNVLLNAGYRVGIIAQPDIYTGEDIMRLGEPELFWGVTGGCMDSMIANYTALKKRRQKDDLTPGGENIRRPDHAVLVYTNLIKKFFKNTRPIVLGGIEASLRRIAHYDFWSNKIQKSILFNSKADILVYGMGEKTIITIAEYLKAQKNITEIPGICYKSREKVRGYLVLPSYEKVITDKHAFIDMFHTFYMNNDPLNASGLCQKQDNRYLIQNPPSSYLSQKELDDVYDMDFERKVHPFYEKLGAVKALETIKFSISTHRGCYGECNFCAISVHQGRRVRWRSSASILKEAALMTELSDFKGYILDVGGPTANMYGIECSKKIKYGACSDKKCLYPDICINMDVNHKKHLDLLIKLRNIKNIKKVFVASGIRYDLILNDKKYGLLYLKELIEHHVSGQMKIAPEHVEDNVLNFMGKPDRKTLIAFKDIFYKITGQIKKKQFLTYYFMAAHPGCTVKNMQSLKAFASNHLKTNPKQVQIFTPSPSTYSSLMYATGLDPFTKARIFIEKDANKKARQKEILLKKHFIKVRP